MSAGNLKMNQGTTGAENGLSLSKQADKEHNRMLFHSKRIGV